MEQAAPRKQKAFFLSPADIMKQKKDAKQADRDARKAKQASHARGPRIPGVRKARGTQEPDIKVYNCDSCGLSKKCKSPNIGRQGQGHMNILFIDQCPNRTEDIKNAFFIGSTGDLLREKCNLFGIDLDRDAICVHSVRCFPGVDEQGRNLNPTSEQLLSCRAKLIQDIQEIKPQLIVCLGKFAMKAILQPEYPDKALEIENIHGLTFPIHKYGCWVGATFRPSDFIYQKDERLNHTAVFVDDLAEIFSFLSVPLPQPLKEEGNVLITSVDEAVTFLEDITGTDEPIAFDFETNSLTPYITDPRILTMSFALDSSAAVCIPLDYIVNSDTQARTFDDDGLARIAIAMKHFLASSTPKIVQNTNMENCWSMAIFGQEMVNFVYDTMIGAHILNCRDETTGLKFQAFRLAGHLYDVGHKENLNELPLNVVANYNCFDARYTYWAYLEQNRRLAEDQNLADFCQIYMAAAPMLSRLRHRGVQLDVKELNSLKEKFTKVRDTQSQIIHACPAVQQYEKEEEKTFSITSVPQIGKVLYTYMKQPIVGKTRTGRPSTDAGVFPEILKKPASPEVTTFINAIIQYRKVDGSGGILKRIENFEKNMDPKGKVHPNLTQNIAKTYRSSSLDPNIQNVPKHDKDQKQLRKAIVAEEGRILLECDKSSLEVRIITMESNDPILTKQLIDKVDFHRDWTKRLYSRSKYHWDDLDEKKRSSLRYDTKNGFVFASFYGSVPRSIANYDAFIEAEISLEHIEKTQAEFWETYKDVRKWQNEVVDQYNRLGFFQALPKFKRRGPLSLFQLYNNPTQGTGFVLFVDGLRRVDEETIRRNLKSFLFVEVHDSCTFQAVEEEIPEIVEYSTAIFESVRFPWQTIPTPVEWEIGKNWYEMEALKFE